MKNKLLYGLFILGSSLMISGCAGSQVVPDNATQTGAAAGAIAGAVIGGNTGSGDGKRIAAGAAIGAAVGGGAGYAIDSQREKPQQNGGWQ